jgi:hypothetical protein
MGFRAVMEATLALRRAAPPIEVDGSRGPYERMLDRGPATAPTRDLAPHRRRRRSSRPNGYPARMSCGLTLLDVSRGEESPEPRAREPHSRAHGRS